MEKRRQEQKKKPELYCSRNEIEEIVKKCNIDRTRFGEYSKTGYSKVLTKFYYSFVDYE